MDNFDLRKYLAENKLLKEADIKDKKIITVKFKNELEKNQTQFVQLSNLSYKKSADPRVTKDDSNHKLVSKEISGNIYEGKLEATDVKLLKDHINSQIFLVGLKKDEDENLNKKFYISIDSGNQASINAVGKILSIS